MERRLPRWKELAPLFDLSIKAPRATNALERCADVGDIRHLARRRVPRMVFDFVDGAAGTEASLDRARQLFERVEYRPHALRDVAEVDVGVDVLGNRMETPFFFAPTGATRLMHASGECAVARVASEVGSIYTLSTLGTTSVERLATAVPDVRRWYQLYLPSDRGLGLAMVQRAWESGYETIALAVDCPVPGRRNRDVRNGLVVPPKLSWASAARIAPYPRWWFDKLTTPPVEFAMVDATSERPAERMARMFDPALSLDDIAWLRDLWPGRLVAKGVQSVLDARDVCGIGVDAVYLSSHGGRQLDRAPLPLELVADVRQELGSDVTIFVDGGVLSGSDIVAFHGRGADAVGIGRAYLYGLMASGLDGVRKVAQVLTAEVRTTLALLGASSLTSVTEDQVRFRP